MHPKLHQNLMWWMPQGRKKWGRGLWFPTVKITPKSNVFCQQNLTEKRIWLHNGGEFFPLYMKLGENGGRMAMLAAGLSAAMAAPVEAQENSESVVLAAMNDTQRQTEMTVAIPHPDGQIIVDVTRIAQETQAEILTELADCFREGREFADADGNGEIDDIEVYDLRDEGAFCAEIAEQEFLQADARAGQAASQERIEAAQAGQAAAQERIAAAQARRVAAEADIRAITDGLIEGARAEGG